ncbi:MAG TPA: nicotinate phosphoribosyltransferase [Actinomycetota bacterium]|nr:nicotinate phosphoribosyltransferase [Actinomycetota bacterium]
MGSALLTDLYELNMAASYLRRGMTAPATFSLFVRNLPQSWGFLVACGLNRCLEFVESLTFTKDDLAYLRSELGFPTETINSFRRLRFTGQVHAVPEGRVVFADEPLLEVTAPLPEAQLVETYLLNQITYQTAVASKAARCRIAAPDRSMVDFSFRRVHGVEASLGVARATAIVGFEATSNVEAARRLGLRPTGTMAHSYIEAFPTEIEAFRAYAEDFPGQVTLLVDTYDTAQGVDKAVRVFRELRDRGGDWAAIRLDSGDLESLARHARKALDQADLHDVQILASGNLDEHEISRLQRADAPIDAYGVGTKIGTSADAPHVDSVYKLVEYDGKPVAKLSAAKRTLPGPKQVWRARDMTGDVISLRSEGGPPGAEPLLEEVVSGGKRLARVSLADARDRFDADFNRLPDSLRSLTPQPYPVDHTPALQRLSEDVRNRIAQRELGP